MVTKFKMAKQLHMTCDHTGSLPSLDVWNSYYFSQNISIDVRFFSANFSIAQLSDIRSTLQSSFCEEKISSKRSKYDYSTNFNFDRIV